MALDNLKISGEPASQSTPSGRNVCPLNENFLIQSIPMLGLYEKGSSMNTSLTINETHRYGATGTTVNRGATQLENSRRPLGYRGVLTLEIITECYHGY